MYQIISLFEDFVPNTDGDGSQQPAVPTQAEMPPAGTGEQESTDGGQSSVSNWEVEKQQLMSQHEQDINRLKSSLQSNAAATENQLKGTIAQLQQQVNELTMKSLPDEQKSAFQQQLAQQQVQQQQQQLAQQNQTLQSQLQAMQWVNYYRDTYGITQAELDTSRGVASIFESGQRLIAQKFKESNGQSITPAPQTPQSTQPASPQAPPVATHTQGIPPQAATVSQIVKEHYGGNEENYWRAVESGRQAPPVS